MENINDSSEGLVIIVAKRIVFPALIVVSIALQPLYLRADVRERPEITVGFIIDLTGPASSLGEDCRQGFEVARQTFAGEDRVNATPIRFVFGDSKGDPKTAVLEFTRMVDSERSLAVLVSRTHLAMAVNPVSRHKQVPLLASSASPSFVSDNLYAFRVWPRADQEGAALAAKAIEKNAKTIAVVTTEDDYLMAMTTSFKSNFTKLNGRVVVDQTVDKDFVDFSSIISQLRTKKPDAVFLNVAIPQLGVAYRRMHELGVRKQAFSSYWVFKKEVLESAGPEALEGAIAVEMDYQRPNFAGAFQARFGHPPPSSMAYSCYVGTAQILQAIGRKPDMHTPAEMYEQLSDAKTIELLDEPGVLEDRELRTPLI